MEGRALLSEYQRANDYNQAQLARALGVSEPLVSMWLSGRRRPSMAKAFAVETRTGGRVPARAWLSANERRQRARTRSDSD